MILCVTNRNLCGPHFLDQILKIAAARPSAILLREKDLDPNAYLTLAKDCRDLLREYRVPLILHSNIAAAFALKIPRIHLTYDQFLSHHKYFAHFHEIGVSVHSVEESVIAEQLGATYLIAGHIFDTASKAAVTPRGLAFLEMVCKAVQIPVWAIGGITPDKTVDILKSGAKGICLMSSLMTSNDPQGIIEQFREATK